LERTTGVLSFLLAAVAAATPILLLKESGYATSAEAYDTFLRSAVDAVVLEDWVVVK
jgi:hypothetical protein